MANTNGRKKQKRKREERLSLVYEWGIKLNDAGSNIIITTLERKSKNIFKKKEM